eukprot:m.206073 g.206073  ORF g.206073 m.206073 type:complete len:67 (-) comp18890_c0_seq1:1138-1338(-)
MEKAREICSKFAQSQHGILVQICIPILGSQHRRDFHTDTFAAMVLIGVLVTGGFGGNTNYENQNNS